MGPSLSLTKNFEENARQLLGLCNGICDNEHANVVREPDESMPLLSRALDALENDENSNRQPLSRLLSLQVTDNILINDACEPLNGEGQANEKRAAVLQLATQETTLFGKIVCLITALNGKPSDKAKPKNFVVGHLHGDDLIKGQGLGLDKVLYYSDSDAGFPVVREFFDDDASIYDSLSVLLSYDEETYGLAKIASNLALMIDETNMRYTLNYVQICQRLGQLEDAITLIERRIDRYFGDSALVHWRLGLLYMQCLNMNITRYEKALACLRKACLIDPDNIEYLHSLVNVCDILLSMNLGSSKKRKINEDALHALQRIQYIKPAKRTEDLIQVFENRNVTMNEFEIDFPVSNYR